MQKVVGSNPISRFARTSQVGDQPGLGRGPVVAQTSSPPAVATAEPPGFELSNVGADKAQAMLFSWLAPGVFAIVAGAFLATGSYVFGAIFSGLAVAARWFEQVSVHRGES
jgi:hypothetical protein